MFELCSPASILKYQENVKLRQKQFHMKDTGIPLPESCAMLFTTLCTGWILKKRTRNIIFANMPKNKNGGGKSVYIPP